MFLVPQVKFGISPSALKMREFSHFNQNLLSLYDFLCTFHDSI